MRKEIKSVYVEDIKIDIEIMTTAKDVLGWMEQYLDNFQYDWFDTTDESFFIVYKDGSTDSIDSFYDGHKIRKQNIKSIVYNNPEDYIVYGDYEINEYGVVTAK